MTGSAPLARGAGRPSLAPQRRHQVLDAFIALIGEHGLESVTLDQVAGAAGVQRTVIRHFVGNRADLVRGAIGRIGELYEAELRAHLGARPSLDDLLDTLFGETWATGLTAYDRAFDALLLEASRDPGTAGAIRATYNVLLDELADAMTRELPETDHGAARDAAYVVTCLAEHNATMIQLGYPPDRSATCRAAARLVVDQLAHRLAAGPEPARTGR